MDESKQHSSLRRDLWATPQTNDRVVVVVDEIRGTYTRVQKQLWETMRSFCANGASENGKEHREAKGLEPAWEQAAAAGWTVRRVSQSSPKRPVIAWLLSWLSMRMPLARIDPLAEAILPVSRIWFSLPAVLGWFVLTLVTLIMVLGRFYQWSGSLPTLSQFMNQVHPFSLAVIFVVTKAIHELGHALMCRRLGGRCGVVGIWWFCFAPCPFVDVSDVWRMKQARHRAMVMVAGMWVESTLALAAAWVWLLANDPTMRMWALQVVLVCGVSTVLFNANPCMRYDGYYILSDWLDSTNLRRDAKRCFANWLSMAVTRWRRLPRRLWALSAFHVVATCYRFLILVVVSMLLLHWADLVAMRRPAILLMLAVIASLVTTVSSRIWKMAIGEGFWAAVPIRRRALLLIAGAIVISGVMWMPLPRWRHTTARLQVAGAINVDLPTTGHLDSINVSLGDRVEKGDVIARMRNVPLELQQHEVTGREAMLQTQAKLATWSSLQSNRQHSVDETNAWQLTQTALVAVRADRREVQQQLKSMVIRSPVTGIVLRGSSPMPNGHAGVLLPDPFDLDGPSRNRSQTGSIESPTDRCWCRVQLPTQLAFEVLISGDDAEAIQTGTSIRLFHPILSKSVIECQVGSVSPVSSERARSARAGHHSHLTAMQWEPDPLAASIVGLIPKYVTDDWTPDDDRWIALDQSNAEATIHLPHRRLMDDCWEQLTSLWYPERDGR
ncbi:MAG: biotin/lipoyl-binding protein [Planctomycetota bacterium]